jgi:cell shape-determining protein MreC
MVIALLLILILTAGAGFYLSFKLQFKEAIYLSIISIIIFSVVYSVSYLQYNIGGSTISIENKIRELDSEQKELKEIIKILVKMNRISADMGGGKLGPLHEHESRLKELQEQLN